VVALAAVLAGLGPGPALAGGGPETTLVVVNADSPLSQQVGNAYVAERGIAPSHVVWLHQVPAYRTIDVETFRRRIWEPVRAYMNHHRLDGDIDAITYSTDFPYRIDFSGDAPHLPRVEARYRGRTGSLTGLTYFARRVERRDWRYLGLRTNFYFRRNLANPALPPRPPHAGERTLYRKARSLFRAKRYVRAIGVYRKFVASYPWSASAWYRLAVSLAATGQQDPSLDALARAVSEGWSNSLMVDADPRFEKLRGTPRLRNLKRRMEALNGPFQPARGFSSRYAWTPTGQAVVDGTDHNPNRYFLATLLGYTGVRGNSVPQVLSYLHKAAASDGTRPDGTVYLMENHNVRSRTRQPLFRRTVADLRRLGRPARILSAREKGQNGVLPQGKQDVMGVVAGSPRYRWKTSGSRFLPGAIAESLTSYGGDFDRRAQTKLSEFLRYGAAGSSGAVAEPFSFWEKFPVPLLHVYYAEGCSLAESFYQSVWAPYQLLVVGDPLARPYARFARVTLRGPDPGRHWRGTVQVRAGLRPPPGQRVAHWELWVDGIRRATARPGHAIVWDTRSVDDGVHRLAVAAVAAGRIQTRSSRRYGVRIANSHRRLRVEQAPSRVDLGDRVQLRGQAPGATRVVLRQGGRALARSAVTDGRWRLAVPARVLGMGKVTVFVRAHYAGGPSVRSRPRTVVIEAPKLLPARPLPAGSRPGLSAVARDGAGEVVRRGVAESLDGDLGPVGRALGAGAGELQVQGLFRVPRDGIYQLVAVTPDDGLSVSVDGQRVAPGGGRAGEANAGPDRFAVLGLAAGWHRLGLRLRPSGSLRLKVLLEGAAPGFVLRGDALRHAGGVPSSGRGGG